MKLQSFTNHNLFTFTDDNQGVEYISSRNLDQNTVHVHRINCISAQGSNQILLIGYKRLNVYTANTRFRKYTIIWYLGVKGVWYLENE